MRSIITLILLMLFLVGGAFALENSKDAYVAKESRARAALKSLQAEYPNIQKYSENNLTTRIYGQGFAFGYDPEDAAENFRLNYSDLLCAEPEDLLPISLLKDKSHTLPMMLNRITGQYKFTLVYYTQHRDNIPVFRSELRLLVRNDPNYPVVLAASALRNLGDFTADNLGSVDFDLAKNAAMHDNSALDQFTEPQTVIFAGVDKVQTKPTLAVTFTASNDFPERWLYVVDAETNEVLYKEDLIVFEDVYGLVEGMATEGTASEQCADELATPLPYARVNIGTNIDWTNSKGTYTVSNFGSDSVDVESRLWGLYFRVYNYTGTDVLLTQRDLPSGPVNFLHNTLNTESVRSQVNAYYHTNVVRDNVLYYVPTYPDVSTHSEFPVYTNRVDGYCPGNAWYDPGDESVNFCSSGDGHPNTAWQSVIHHEYGHHMVNMAGSGQGEYGEGMSDCVAMMWGDESELGIGFYGSCSEALRNADNSIQYPCSGAIHYCGQLLSGCVWETRNELAITYPGSYLDTLRNLVFHSILLHTGTSIDPTITIDFLTLDDDDANLDNGTPHYAQICVGFGEHNMDCPDLNPVWFEYTGGRPEMLYPGTSTTFEVVIHPQAGTPTPGTGEMHYSLDGGAYVQGTMVETSTNIYNVSLPGADCNSIIDWYLSVDAGSFGTITDPEFAPSNHHSAFVATDSVVVFEDNFDTDMGWTVSGGTWARGTPTGGGGEYGGPDPSSGHSGTTVFGYNLSGDYENDMVERHLTSPALDCTDMVHVKMKFWRWLGVEQPSYDHAYIRVSNDGSNWIQLWTNEETMEDNSWNEMEFDLSAVADNQATVYLRWTMGTTDGSWRYCGWNIDDVEVSALTCASTAPVVTTESIPDWTLGEPFSLQLEAASGTGVYTWTDKNADLTGTGLSLSSSGLLSGTPAFTGMITFTAMVTDETPESGEKVFSFTINPSLVITTTLIPDWSEGVGYLQQLSATGGTGAKTWTDKNGDLSGTGLVLSASGQILGTPNAPGPISFTAVVTDSIGAFDEQPFSLTINPAIAITTASLPEGQTDVPYSQQLTSTGGTGTATWTDKNNDLNGSGLTLSATGLLSGTVTVAGTISFTAKVDDAIGSTDEKPFSFEIVPALTITTEQVPDWTVDNPYSFQMESVGGVGTKNWSDKNGDLTGTGLSISSAGLISGTPTSTGEISFTAMVSDEGKESTEKPFTMTINPSLTITTALLPDWTAGVPYSRHLEASGGTGTVNWTDKNNDLFGTGLSLSSSGHLTGTVSMGDNISFTAQVSDQGGDVEEKVYSFTVNDPIMIDVASLPPVTLGAPYSYQLIAIGGTGDLTWSDQNDDLTGTGLTLSTAGLLSGTPVSAGQISFTAMVSDEIGSFKTKGFSVTVNPSLDIISDLLPDWTVNQPYSEQLMVTGGTGSMTWGDVNSDLDGTGLTLAGDGLLSGTPILEGAVSFTASVTDQGGGYTEQLVSLTINPEVSIMTETLPDCKEDEAYSQLLESTGGTGEINWSDLNDDLLGTGLTLASDGLLSGIPDQVGEINFTAEITDETGNSDSKLLTVNITPAFICGDGNGDELVNILDVTFLIDYSYNGGTAPEPMERADVNSDFSVNILDITYLINYLYKGGPEPVCP